MDADTRPAYRQETAGEQEKRPTPTAEPFQGRAVAKMQSNSSNGVYEESYENANLGAVCD